MMIAGHALTNLSQLSSLLSSRALQSVVDSGWIENRAAVLPCSSGFIHVHPEAGVLKAALCNPNTDALLTRFCN